MTLYRSPLLLLALLACTPDKDADKDSGKPTEPHDSPADTGTRPGAADDDQDGISASDGDCDDSDPEIRPLAPERCNGLDDNCNVRVDEGFADGDSDGIADCIDAESCDGLDNDGDGGVDEGMPDTDGDGIADCADAEGCDGLDNDGDGSADEGFDRDGDGATGDGADGCGPVPDCDDGDAEIHPGAAEITDDRDNDCDGAADENLWRAGDLVITEIMINPSSVLDTDGEWVEIMSAADGPRWLNGLRLEGGGAASLASTSGLIRLLPGERRVVAAHLSPALNGGVAAELEAAGLLLSNEGGHLSLWMDGLEVDRVAWGAGEAQSGASRSLDPAAADAAQNDDPANWCDAAAPWDTDTDLGSPGAPNASCPAFDHDGDGFTGMDGDCDDADPRISPAAPEIAYDGVDQDCDGISDYDADRDGHDATVFGGEDCDDQDPGANPDALEVCDALDTDEDCDGYANLDDPDILDITLWYPDADRDGWGDAGAALPSCEDPGGRFVLEGGDCDDADPAVNPAASEICGNGVDDDCDADRDGCGVGGDIAGEQATATLNGLNQDGLFGAAVSAAGDLDGDGYGDLLVGATGDGNRNSGMVYVFHGPLSGTLETADAAARFIGVNNSDNAGQRLCGGEDWTGDGVPDLWISAPSADVSRGDEGVVYLVDGTSGSGSLSGALAQIGGAASSDNLGEGLSLAGDVDADGAPDLWIGATNGGGRRTDGAVYLMSGLPSGAITSAAAARTFVAEGTGDDAGKSVSGGMDGDGDGLPDLLVGAPGWSSGGRGSEGRVYVVSGAAASGSLSGADAAWDGTNTDSGAGTSLAWIGDIDGDGLADALIGGPADSTAGVGAAWLLLDPFVGGALSDAEGVLEDSGAGDRIGGSVAAAGDVDGDGMPDFLVGAPASDLSGIHDGTLFLFYAPFSGTIHPEDVTDRLSGAGAGQLGHSATGFDMNGDGFSDVIGGAWQASTNASAAGGVLVFMGGAGW